jgi:hypothetical protein
MLTGDLGIDAAGCGESASPQKTNDSEIAHPQHDMLIRSLSLIYNRRLWKAPPDLASSIKIL